MSKHLKLGFLFRPLSARHEDLIKIGGKQLRINSGPSEFPSCVSFSASLHFLLSYIGFTFLLTPSDLGNLCFGLYTNLHLGVLRTLHLECAPWLHPL